MDKFTSTSVSIDGVRFVSTAPAEDGTDRTELPMNAYYLSNNVFYPHKNNKVTIKAGLCYMVLGAEAAAKGYSLNFQNEDGSVTGIRGNSCSQGKQGNGNLYLARGKSAAPR